ncbi:MAG: glycosyltransferase [Armatimonadetes bacterium]|nr:glycosyltransferase [Armatimonadota bacterium]
MRVLLVVPTLERGGAERMVVELARGMARRQIPCQVAYLDGAGTLAPEIEQAGVPARCLRLPHKAWPAAGRLARLLRDLSPTLIHAHMPRAGLWAAMAKPSGAALVYTEHNMQELYPGYCAWFYRYFLPRTEAVIAVSRDAAQSFSGRWPAHADKVTIIQTGVPLDDLRADQTPAQLRARHGVTDDEHLVCAVGAVRPPKAYPYLAQAVRKLLDRGVRVRALVVGSKKVVPAEADRVEAEIRRLGVQDAMQLVGEVPKAFDYIAAAELLVLSSVQEGLPRVILEAMAAGKPVVAPDIGGCGEAIIHEETGLLVPPEDPEALADAIERLLAAPDEAVTMGERGRQRVEAMFTIEAMIERHLQVYRRASGP